MGSMTTRSQARNQSQKENKPKPKPKAKSTKQPTVSALKKKLSHTFNLEQEVQVQGASGEWYLGHVKQFKVTNIDNQYTLLYEVRYRGNCKRWVSTLKGRLRPSPEHEDPASQSASTS